MRNKLKLGINYSGYEKGFDGAMIELVDEPSKKRTVTTVTEVVKVVKTKNTRGLAIQDDFNEESMEQFREQMNFSGDQEQEQYEEEPISAELGQLGISEYELDKQCEDLFSDTPIKFKARKGNKIDEKIKAYIQELDIKFPIEQIKDSLYLVGSERCNIKQHATNDSLLVRQGAGWVKFDDHVLKQDKFYQRALVMHMIKSGESLEWVLEQLISNKKIHNSLVDMSAQSDQRSSRKSRLSPTAAGSSTPTGRTSSTLKKQSSNTGFGRSSMRASHQ